MENSQMMRRSEGRRLGTGIGWTVLVTVVLYIWVMSHHSLESLESLIMLLTIVVSDLLRCVGEKSIWNNTLLHHLILRCGRNVFGIYLIEDYLRNATVFIWEWSAPYISAVPACIVWLLAVFLLGNILLAGLHRVPILINLLLKGMNMYDLAK